MGDLILRTRLSMLRRNLMEVPQAVERVEESRKYLSDFATTFDDVAIKRLLRAVEDAVRGATRALEDEDYGEARAKLEAIADAPTELRKRVLTLTTKAAALGRHSLDLSELDIGSLLMTEATDQAETAKRLEAELKTGAAPADIWTDYRGQLFVVSQRVFTEYVDVLGGLALRQAGLDDGICRMADAITAAPKQLLPANVHWRSLTLPAQREALEETVAQIVRLGFPEWTIWALPLAAHEFAHVIVGHNEKLREIVAQGTAGESRSILVADAFATTVMGPAYACAVLLMRLDPWNLPAGDVEGRRLGVRRAAVILATLRLLSRDYPDDPLRAVRETLTKAWTDALEQTGVAERADDDAVAALAEAVYAVAAPKFAIWGERWADIDGEEGLAAQLAAGTAAEVAPDEFDVVLNAAWAARLRNGADEQVEQRIADTVREIWNTIDTGGGGAAEQAQRRAGAQQGAASPAAGEQP